MKAPRKLENVSRDATAEKRAPDEKRTSKTLFKPSSRLLYLISVDEDFSTLESDNISIK